MHFLSLLKLYFLFNYDFKNFSSLAKILLYYCKILAVRVYILPYKTVHFQPHSPIKIIPDVFIVFIIKYEEVNN